MRLLNERNTIKSICLKLCLIYILGINLCSSSSLPVLFLHGIGDACDFPDVKRQVEVMKQKLQSEVKCVEIGNGFVTSWFRKFSKQAEEACEKVKVDPLFKDKFSIFAVSQGNLIARYIIQNCDMPGQVVNYVAFNGPQMGIGSLPKITCPVICPIINRLVAKIVYKDYFQTNFGPSGYYKDRYSYSEYLEHSTFLADLNNERTNKTVKYKERFSSLDKVLLIKNLNDTVITPKESSFFEFYDDAGEEIVALRNSTFYKEDWIGLRHLDENNKLTLLEILGEHAIISPEDIEKYVIPYLK